MTRPVALVTDYAWPTLDIERAILEAAGIDLLVADCGDEAELVALAPRADAILTCWRKVTPAVLDAAGRCRIVARYGIGLDNIDVAHATRLGIPVTNVPDFCLEEVSDHAMALLLAIARRIVPFAAETRAGTWDPRLAQQLPRVRGRALGLVGYGAIARTLVPKARGFGLEVLAWTPRLTPGPLGDGATAVSSLNELLARADYVSIHAPLNAETRGLIGAPELAAMKPDAWLINTSRGPIVDEGALYAALRDGGIGGAALDVLAQEPPDPASPLLALPNVIVTPHVAFSSADAVADLQRKAATRVVEALRGEVPSCLVNPAVLADPSRRLARPYSAG